jgi:hypothetical protein
MTGPRFSPAFPMTISPRSSVANPAKPDARDVSLPTEERDNAG